MSTANDFKTLGNQAFTQKNFEEAIGHYNKAIELNPNDATFFSNRSGCFASLNKFEEALADANKCIELNPNFIKGYSRKGLALVNLGKEDDALEAYNDGLKIDPKNEQLLKDKASIEEAGQSQMGDMMNLFNNPEIQKMMKENPQLLQTLLQNPNMLKDPAMLANMMKMFGGAKGGPKPDGPKTPNSGSNPWDTHAHSGDNCCPEPTAQPTHKSHPKEETHHHAKEETKPQPKNEPSKSSLFDEAKKTADSEYKKKNFEAAIASYDECIKLNPKNLIPYSNKAACLIELKKYDEALNSVNKAIETYKEEEPKDRNYQSYAKVLGRKGRIYHLTGNYTEAIKVYQDSLMEDKSSLVEEHLRESRNAMKKKEELDYINPELSEQHREKGNELFQKGDFGNAIKEYEEAKKRNPKDAKVYNNMASCFVKIIKPNDAMKEVEKAIELDPKFIKAYLRKAMIHNMVKEHHKALDVYNKVLSMEPDNKDAKEGIQTTESKITSSMHEGNDEERLKRAMNDPEVVAIMSDPMVKIALEQMQANPKNIMEYMSDKTLGPKINKLIAAGIIKTR